MPLAYLPAEVRIAGWLMLLAIGGTVAFIVVKSLGFRSDFRAVPQRLADEHAEDTDVLPVPLSAVTEGVHAWHAGAGEGEPVPDDDRLEPLDEEERPRFVQPHPSGLRWTLPKGVVAVLNAPYRSVLGGWLADARRGASGRTSGHRATHRKPTAVRRALSRVGGRP